MISRLSHINFPTHTHTHTHTHIIKLTRKNVSKRFLTMLTSSTEFRNFSENVMKLITHINLVPSLRIRGALPPLPHKPSWRDA